MGLLVISGLVLLIIVVNGNRKFRAEDAVRRQKTAAYYAQHPEEFEKARARAEYNRSPAGKAEARSRAKASDEGRARRMAGAEVVRTEVRLAELLSGRGAQPAWFIASPPGTYYWLIYERRETTGASPHIRYIRHDNLRAGSKKQALLHLRCCS